MRMKRLAAPKDSLVLCLPNEPLGSVVIDSRGQWYCLTMNNWGERAGLRRMTEPDIEFAKRRGVLPRPSSTMSDLFEIVLSEADRG